MRLSAAGRELQLAPAVFSLSPWRWSPFISYEILSLHNFSNSDRVRRVQVRKDFDSIECKYWVFTHSVVSARAFTRGVLASFVVCPGSIVKLFFDEGARASR